MRHRIADNTPAYAAEIIASAQSTGRQLIGSCGIFAVLLIAMSVIEAPLSRSEEYARPPENELINMRFGRTPAHRTADTPVAQVGGASSSDSPTFGEPSCLPSQARSVSTSGRGDAERRPTA
jgi:hypothetical protein